MGGAIVLGRLRRNTAFAIKAEVSDPRAKTFMFAAQDTMYGGKHIADFRYTWRRRLVGAPAPMNARRGGTLVQTVIHEYRPG